MSGHKFITEKLEKALYFTSDVLSQSLISDISIYIHAREWTVTFEILCANLYEYELPVSARTYELLEEVGLTIKTKKDYWENLKPQINPDL